MPDLEALIARYEAQAKLIKPRKWKRLDRLHCSELDKIGVGVKRKFSMLTWNSCLTPSM